LGAFLILIGLAFMAMQFYVSVKERRQREDLTGDPWNGRTLEWLTSSPPAPYNFAIIPHVDDLDAFAEMKRRGTAYHKPARYEDIEMPKNSGIGVVLGALSFVLGFAMIWNIWWLAIACGVAMLIALIARSSDDDSDYILPAKDVEAIETKRFEALARAAPRHADDGAPVVAGRPLPGSAR
jgi:cytochrome o ubiquinol oxidase subunit 1